MQSRYLHAGMAAAAAASLAVLSTLALPAPADAGPSVRTPAPRVDAKPSGRREVAVFAGGCFWGVEAVFEHVAGVESATSGYAGGSAATADYETVSAGSTAHAEAVRVIFDPARVSYGQLLRIYFSVVADPTLLNRQGPDHGTQYRTALFPRSDAQARVAAAYIAQLGAARTFPRPIVTRIERGAFFPAEPYHQDFMARNPAHPYIVVNDAPKVVALRNLFPTVYRR